ncbi:MAG: MMPL family transporter, partial [Acidobacteriota bacterium]
ETFEREDRLNALERLAAELRDLPRVLGAVGGGDVLAEARNALTELPATLPGSPSVPVRPLEALLEQPAGRELFRSFVTADGRRARITLFVETTGYRELEPSFEAAERMARQAVSETPGAEAAVTGQFPLILETHRRLLATLGISLSLTTLAVGLLFRWLLPSTRLTLLALAPNLWPVAATVGVMGWAGVPLDTSTVMVASVVLGLAVDDTIHTLGHFRELAPRLGRLEAVAGTLERTAPAYVLTGAILAIGFGVCALSDFAPTARFGGLSALAILLAVLGDLFLLPALLGSTPHAVIHRLGRSPIDRSPGQGGHDR